MTVDKGRLEDLLRLAVKGDQPPMTGAINFHTKFDLPHGKGDLADRLNLNGKFDVEQAQFTSPEVTAKIETLSRKGQGQPENKDAGSSVSQLKGNFVLDNGVITFRGLTFTVTGAQVALDGKYGLEKEDLDFHGKLRMQAKLSQTMTGAKSFVLKAVDPFFRKNGQTEVPIKITGPAGTPILRSRPRTTRIKTRENEAQAGGLGHVLLSWLPSWLLRLGSSECSGLPPGSGKSVSEDFSIGFWSRCPELALHGSIARRFLRPILLHGAFAAVLVISQSRIEIVFQVSHRSSSSQARNVRKARS